MPVTWTDDDIAAWLDSLDACPTPDGRPSPDFTGDPVWARRLITDVPRLARHLGIPARPVGDMEWEDILAHFRMTLIVRSRSAKSHWSKGRGRDKYSGWMCMVIESQYKNLLRRSRVLKRAMVTLVDAPDQVDIIGNYSGGCWPACVDSHAKMNASKNRWRALRPPARAAARAFEPPLAPPGPQVGPQGGFSHGSVSA